MSRSLSCAMRERVSPQDALRYCALLGVQPAAAGERGDAVILRYGARGIEPRQRRGESHAPAHDRGIARARNAVVVGYSRWRRKSRSVSGAASYRSRIRSH